MVTLQLQLLYCEFHVVTRMSAIDYLATFDLEKSYVCLFIFIIHPFAVYNEEHEARPRNRSRRRDWFSRPDKRGGDRAFTSISRAAQRNRSPFFLSSSPPPSKITHAWINSPRVLCCYVANLFHARSSLPKINPLAITKPRTGETVQTALCADMGTRYEPFCRQNRWYSLGQSAF